MKKKRTIKSIIKENRKIYTILKTTEREILWLLPKKLSHKILYKKFTGKKLNLKNPQDFNQKIHYLMIYEYGKQETQLADKYLVREYVTERGYSNILTKIYKIYKNVDEINLNELPEKFVLKTNNGSGKVYVCIDKEKFNLNEIKKALKKNLKENFAKECLEYHYAKINPLIICEQYLGEDDGTLPKDYKIYCFNGKAECILVCSEREKKLKLDYYDFNWNYLNYAKEEYKSKKEISKPKKLKEMLKIAEDLSRGHKYVRVDLYEINEKIYFGEMTFTPAAGLIKYNTEEALKYLGDLIKIPTKN